MPRPLVMGILNVTPDSFSDGGRYFARDAALARAERLVREGADILDVGGESTRPGASPVGESEELERVLPVLAAVRERFDVRLSIDTTKQAVAREAVRAGATIVNDVAGGEGLSPAEFPGEVDFILMHRRGTPADMSSRTEYPRGVVTEVAEYLAARVRAFVAAGVARERVWVDPGIGFAKTAHGSLQLLRGLESFRGLGGRLVIGTSRKSFLSKIAGVGEIAPDERLAGTLASNLWAYAKGASVFRVHDVAEMRRALATWEAIVQCE